MDKKTKDMLDRIEKEILEGHTRTALNLVREAQVQIIDDKKSWPEDA